MFRNACLLYKTSKIDDLFSQSMIYFRNPWHGNTGGYKRLLGVTRDYKGLQGVTGGNQGLQGVIGG